MCRVVPHSKKGDHRKTLTGLLSVEKGKNYIRVDDYPDIAAFVPVKDTTTRLTEGEQAEYIPNLNLGTVTENLIFI